MEGMMLKGLTWNGRDDLSDLKPVCSSHMHDQRYSWV